MREGDFDLPDWAPIVLAHESSEHRKALAILLAFDFRLARIVHGASEPMLGQIRLAWWREEIAKDRICSDAMPPDPMLSAIIEQWGDHSHGLLALVDGWENLLGDPPWTSECHQAFCKGRSLALSTFAELSRHSTHRDDVGAHGKAWGLTEIVRANREGLREPLSLPRLPRSLRSIAVLGGLSQRAVRRGDGALLGDRLSPLVALRLGIFGI